MMKSRRLLNVRKLKMAFKTTAVSTTSTNQDRPQVDFKALGVEEGYFG